MTTEQRLKEILSNWIEVKTGLKVNYQALTKLVFKIVVK